MSSTYGVSENTQIDMMPGMDATAAYTGLFFRWRIRNVAKDETIESVENEAEADECSNTTKPMRATRKKKKKKRSLANRKKFEVKVIPATIGVDVPGEEPRKKRVAAYCRVSTDEEAQATSFDLQVKYYTGYIGEHENWVLVEIYADEGISGTQVKHRENFLRMIEDCRAAKIDMIITKSISRFARNVVDCLTYLRELKAQTPPVEVYFEKERLSSLDDKTDMVLSLMASIAQEESRSISANIRWAYKNRMKEGTQRIPTNALLGYDTDDDGDMVIVAQEAEAVRLIYRSFVQGVHPTLIATRLNSIGQKTVYGNLWTGPAIRAILRNEKYCGDVVMQKTVTIDYLTHKSKKNEGEAEKYYVPDHHDTIVTRELWNKAQEILDKTSWKRWKQRGQIRLTPVRRGCLAGFVPIHEDWKEISWKRLESATEKIVPLGVELPSNNIFLGKNESEEIIMAEHSVLAGFEVIDLSQTKSDSVLSISTSSMKFNKATAAELNYPAHVRVMVNAPAKKVAIQSCTEKTPNAIAFSQEADKQTYAIILKVPALQAVMRKQLPDLAEKKPISFKGEIHLDEQTIIYDLTQGKTMSRQRRTKQETDEEQIRAAMEKVSEELLV